MSNTVLLVEDDSAMRKSITQSLRMDGLEVLETGSFEEAVLHLNRRFEGVVLTDIRLPGKDGFEVLNHCRSLDEKLPVLLLTGEGDIPMALEAVRQGACEFLEKPIHPDQLTQAIKKWLMARELTLKNRLLEERLNQTDSVANAFPGRCEAIKTFRKRLREVSTMPLNVHIQGQDGTGKSLAAQAIHDLSKTYGDIVLVDAVSVQASSFEAEIKQARGGTLLLRNIELASIEQQTLIQGEIEGASKVRIVTTSSDSLDECLTKGMLKSLYYTLNVVTLDTLTLKERQEDILEIFQTYLLHYSKTFNASPPAVTSEVRAALMARSWDGNLKELQAFAQRFTLGFTLSDEEDAKLSLSQQVRSYERLLLVEALQIHNGSTQLAADELRIPVATLYDKLRKHDLKPKQYRSS